MEIPTMANTQQNTPQNKNRNKQDQAPGQQEQFGSQNAQGRRATGQRDQADLQQSGRDRDLDEQNQRRDKDQAGRKSGH
jgi:hypothetical protein